MSKSLSHSSMSSKIQGSRKAMLFWKADEVSNKGGSCSKIEILSVGACHRPMTRRSETEIEEPCSFCARLLVHKSRFLVSDGELYCNNIARTGIPIGFDCRWASVSAARPLPLPRTSQITPIAPIAKFLRCRTARLHFPPRQIIGCDDAKSWSPAIEAEFRVLSVSLGTIFLELALCPLI